MSPYSPSQKLTLIAMCLALSMAALDDTVVNVALPNLQSQLDLSVSQLQWMLNGYLLPIACLVLSAGMLGDVFGRRRLFLCGLSGFVVASVFVGLAANGPMAILGRVLQGIGAAALLPTSLAILSDAFSDLKERAKAIGIWSGVSGLALIVGPALGGVMVDALGWRSIFFLNVPLGLCTAWLTCRAVPSKPASADVQVAKGRLRLDKWGMGLSAVVIASLLIVLTQGEGLPGGLNGALMGVVGVSAITFIAVERVHQNPVLPLSLFRKPTLSVSIIANALLFYTLVSLLFLFSLFLQQIQGHSAMETGIRLLPLNAAFILASVVSGYCAGRLGWRATVIAGFTLAGTAILALLGMQVQTPFQEMVGPLMLVGFGFGLTLSPLTSAAMSSASDSRSGIVAALMNTSTRLGGALGVAVQGGIFASGMGTALVRSLTDAGIVGGKRQALVAEAIGHGATRPAQLEEILGDAPGLVTDLIHQAFMAGLHQTVQMGAIALFVAAGLNALLMMPRRREMSRDAAGHVIQHQSAIRQK